jgi:hypothetical protein
MGKLRFISGNLQNYEFSQVPMSFVNEAPVVHKYQATSSWH